MERVTVLDMDYTLLNCDSSTGWCHYLKTQGLVTAPDFLTREKALMEAYDRGEMHVEDYIAFSMGELRDYSVTELNAHLERYARTLVPARVFPEALSLLKSLKETGERTLIISATAACIVRKVAALLGVPEVIAVECATENGHYTGKIVGEPPFQEGKVTALRRYLKDRGLEGAFIHFYTDSINDLPLCRMADAVSVINPALPLLKEARVGGFEVLRWGEQKKAPCAGA